MSLHKLTAGSGYDYLTRQVAAHDSTEKGHLGLASYYAAKGESPGVWVGSGMAGIEGLTAGDVVTAEQMQALFGFGHHPLEEARRAEVEAREGTPEEVREATRLGRPFTKLAFEALIADLVDVGSVPLLDLLADPREVGLDLGAALPCLCGGVRLPDAFGGGLLPPSVFEHGRELNPAVLPQRLALVPELSRGVLAVGLGLGADPPTHLPDRGSLGAGGEEPPRTAPSFTDDRLTRHGRNVLLARPHVGEVVLKQVLHARRAELVVQRDVPLGAQEVTNSLERVRHRVAGPSGGLVPRGMLRSPGGRGPPAWMSPPRA